MSMAIINSWSLRSFRDSKGKMEIADLTNGDSGETYKNLAFIHPETGKTCFVSFSQKLPSEASTKAYLKANVDKLQVVQLEVAPDVLERRVANGKQLESYNLCLKGENAWEDADDIF